MLLAERPAIDMEQRLTVPHERPALPLLIPPDQMECAIETVGNSRQRRIIMVPGHRHHRNPRGGKPAHPFFNRADRLVIAIGVIDEIATDRDEIDPFLNGKIDNRPPGRG